MGRMERRQEPVSAPPSAERVAEMQAAGWKLAGVVWERETAETVQAPWLTEVPYGYRIAADCQHLEEDPLEQRALMAMLDLFARDIPLRLVAEELNRQGFRTRTGEAWTPVTVFHMHPRLIEAGPRIAISPEWIGRRVSLAD